MCLLLLMMTCDMFQSTVYFDLTQAVPTKAFTTLVAPSGAIPTDRAS